MVLFCCFFEPIRLNDIGHHFRQMLIARNGLQNLFAGNSVRTGLATRVDGHGLDELTLEPGLQSAKTDVCGLMVSASGRASGPMNGQRIPDGAKPLMKRFGKRDGAAFCLDESEVAVVRPYTRHHVAQKG